MPKSKIKNLIKPEDFAKAAEKAVIAAASAPGKGGDKRAVAVKALAKWLDDSIKLPWFLELVDGPAFYLVAMILAPHVEAAYQKVFKFAPADPCGPLKNELADLEYKYKELRNERDQLDAELIQARKEIEKLKAKKVKVAPVEGAE